MLSAISVTTLMPIKKAIRAIESYSSQYRLRARMPLHLGNEVHESPLRLMVGDRFAAIASSSSINMFKIGRGKRIHAWGKNFVTEYPSLARTILSRTERYNNTQRLRECSKARILPKLDQ